MAFAAKRMTVEQLQQTLAADGAEHRSDDFEARQLAEVKLTDRLSMPTLQALIATSAGPKTTQSLRYLADASAFLTPVATEIPANPAPDLATQKAIIANTVHYVARTLPTLPNFTATRVTQQLVDSVLALRAGYGESLGGLFLVKTFHVPVSYRDGAEIIEDAPLSTSAKKRDVHKNAKDVAVPTQGLSSRGEFGPILSTVLIDAARGKLGWARWELLDGKTVAVFQFSVDRSVSHFSTKFWEASRPETAGSLPNSPLGGRRGDRAAAVPVNDSAPLPQRNEFAGYHGLLSVDPDTGAILRIAIEAESRPGDEVQGAAMLVEYGPVQIGETTYICPTHSIAILTSDDPYQLTPTSPIQNVTELHLNDVEFTEYHRFGSESTVIAAAPPTPSSSVEESAAATGASVSPVAETAPVAVATAVPAAPTPPTASASPTSPPTPAGADQEILVKAAEGLPGMETDVASGDLQASRSKSNFTLQVTTRIVDLGLIATDKHNKPITNLKPEEVEIYDNGRRQHLADFVHFDPSAPAVAQSKQSSEPSTTFNNASITLHEAQNAPDLMILLLDESHLPFNDLNRARGEVERFLKATRPDSRIALYSIGEHGFRVIQDVTADHAVVEAKLAAWMPTAAGVAQAAALDTRNRQQFDYVRNPSDLDYVNGNHTDEPDYITSVDPQLREMGDNPLGNALNSMIALARHFGPVAGHKSLVWISGDSALEDWSDQTPNSQRTVKSMAAAINHTKEALSEAHLALYAVDASPVSVGGAAVDPSLANPNVQVNPVSTSNSAPGGSGTNRLDPTGRVTAAMQQDTRGIQSPVRELAEATGGRAINKGSDLKATLDGIEQDSTAQYEIGFHPDTPADGKFHTLQVKIPVRKDVKLRYRTGYLYSEESQNTQQRFQQAVWSPQDATAITLTGEAVAAADSQSGSPTIQLRIAFPGLSLEQKADRWTDQLYIFVAQRDDATQKAEVSGDTLRLSLKQATYDTGMPAGIPYQRAIETKPKLGTVRIIVVDGNSGKMGSVTLPSSALHP
jgi:VWFA-related protein